MAWKELKINSITSAENQAFISISTSHIRFSSVFVSKLNINENYFVKIFVDEEQLRIGFHFVEHCEGKCLRLTRPKNKDNFQVSSQSLIKNHPWVKKYISELTITERRFKAKSEFSKETKNNLWVISLGPSFENKILKTDALKRGSDLRGSGIYRYVNSEKNEIVYIGKGDIRKRLSSPEREDWSFDLLEYSIITEEKLQFRWEKYWLDKFEYENGRLPFYNQISGKNTH